MLFLSCGTCGVSALSVQFPWLGEWLILSVLTAVQYNWANHRLQREGRSLLEQFILIAIAVVLSAIMLAGLILPFWFLVSVLVLLRNLLPSDLAVRGSAATLLLLFLASAALRYNQMMAMDQREYLVGRFLAGSPGYHHYNQLASQEPFDGLYYANFVAKGTLRQSTNASHVLERRAQIFLKKKAELDQKKSPEVQLTEEYQRMAAILDKTPAEAQENLKRVQEAYHVGKN